MIIRGTQRGYPFLTQNGNDDRFPQVDNPGQNNVIADVFSSLTVSDHDMSDLDQTRTEMVSIGIRQAMHKLLLIVAGGSRPVIVTDQSRHLGQLPWK